MPTEEQLYRSMKYGVGPQDAEQKGSWKDVATLGAQMLPMSDIAREVGASDLEPTISEDIKNKRYMDALLKAISTAGDVGTGTGAVMMSTGAGAVPGAALIGASQLAKLAAKAANHKLYGFKIWESLPNIIKDATLKYVYSASRTKGEAASFLGIAKQKYSNLLKKYNISEYFKTNTIALNG